MKYKMYKFQYKFTTLNFLSCANLHMIEKPFFFIMCGEFYYFLLFEENFDIFLGKIVYNFLLEINLH